MNDAEVMFINHLQVTFSNRWLFSKTNNFELVKKMISDNPEYKQGLMMKFG
jgi:hypothetical protein